MARLRPLKQGSVRGRVNLLSSPDETLVFTRSLESPVERADGKGGIILLAAGKFFPADLAPMSRIESRKPRVALGLQVDLGQVDAVGARQHQRKNLPTADDGDFLAACPAGTHRRFRQCGLGIGDDGRAWRFIPARAANDDIVAAGKRALRQALPGLAAHDQRLAHGDRLEKPHIGGKLPWQPAIATYDAVLRDGDNEGDLGFHRRHDRAGAQTATGAAMWGWL